MSGLGCAHSVALVGVHGHIVEIEAAISSALPHFTIIGLPDVSISESRDRIRSALSNVELPLPARRITVNLAPAALPKAGTHFDLGIAIALLNAANQLNSSAVSSTVFIGELGLDGRIHPVPGVLPAVAAAREAGFAHVVVPQGNLEEALLIQGISVRAFSHLGECASAFGAPAQWREASVRQFLAVQAPELEIPPDMGDVTGQYEAKIGLEVAAAGGHNMVMVGPPGTGKTMLASRLPSILPQLSIEHAMEVAAVRSLSGVLNAKGGLDRRPPFESPHHSATAAAIIGGGSKMIRPGSVSRAHRGVLFLDEAPEFSTRVLQTLRQPLESKQVHIARVALTTTLPANFQLIAAANPCPCGLNYGSGDRCTCSSVQRRRYLGRLSGPLLDRIDIQVDVLPEQISVVTPRAENSDQIRKRVANARAIATERLDGTPWTSNSDMSGTWIRQQLGARSSAVKEVGNLVRNSMITMRGADRILRVAWTLADLRGASSPAATDVLAAHAMKVRAV